MTVPLNEIDLNAVSHRTVRQRNLDVAKGIGIALVVHGHLSGAVVDAIFLVHMPLFFVIAGVLSRADPADQLVRRIVSIVIPYSVFLFLLWILPSVMAYLFEGADEWEVFKQLGKALIGGEALIGPAAVFWFPTAYAFMLVIASIVFRLSLILQILITLFISGSAITLSSLWPGFFLPLSLNVAPVAFLFFVLGRFFQEHDFHKVNFANCLLVGFGILAVVGTEYGLWPSINMKRAEFGYPIFSLLLSAVGSLAIIVVSSFLSRFQISRLIAYMGLASLFVMYTHMALAIFLRSIVTIPGHILALLTLVICLLMYELVRRSRTMSVLLLGKAPKTLHSKIAKQRRREEFLQGDA